MAHTSDRDRLLAAMSKTEVMKQKLKAARAKVMERTREQFDSMAEPIELVESHRLAGREGILMHRAHRAKLTERERLRTILDTGDRDNPHDLPEG